MAVVASASLLRDPDKEERLRNSIRAHELLMLSTSGEPELTALANTIAELRRFGPDWIVAAGGGSTLDAAKIAWIFYEHPDADLERLLRPFSLSNLRGRARFAAVPTTAGTGSEVSSSALFAERPGGEKRAVVSHLLLPDLVVLDPELATGVPQGAAASAGLDALSHALEGYVSRFDNPFADLQAEQAVRILFRTLAASVAAPSMDNLLLVMHAALMAGWVQNLKVPGAGHALAHQLARYGLAHGHCTGALLVPAMRYNCADPSVHEKYTQLSVALGFSNVEELMLKVDELRAELGASSPLPADSLGDVRQLAEAALQDPCARANPRSLTADALISILKSATAES